jgi:hypothetical protein
VEEEQGEEDEVLRCFFGCCVDFFAFLFFFDELDCFGSRDMASGRQIIRNLIGFEMHILPMQA